jgi:hypothetical protein
VIIVIAGVFAMGQIPGGSGRHGASATGATGRHSISITAFVRTLAVIR